MLQLVLLQEHSHLHCQLAPPLLVSEPQELHTFLHHPDNPVKRSLVQLHESL